MQGMRQRALAADPSCKLLKLGGDGLLYIRMLRLIADNPAEYLQKAPAVIPGLGEQPHGLFHLTHAVWRIFNDFIMICMDAIGNEQVQLDPKVEEHNAVQHAMQILIRAAAEYVRELSDEVGAIPFAMKSKFIAACERNIDMAELVHFLDDGGFLVLQHKNAVRTDDERLLDLSWREFVTLGRSVAGHKTQCAFASNFQSSVCAVTAVCVAFCVWHLAS
jgi:hypothetical protein